MPDSATDSPPDRFPYDPSSPHFNAEALARDVRHPLQGRRKTNVEEYCVRRRLGTRPRRQGVGIASQALDDQAHRPVEAYFRNKKPE